jgi:hypothetical protein
MATDKSEPRVGLIFRIAFLVIVSLVSIRAALNSYFDQIASAEEQRKFGDIVPEALNDLHADELKRLNEGPMPIQKAMQDMASKGRKDMGSDFMPATAASRDIGPLQGWQKMPSEVPPAMTATAAPEPIPAAVPADAGAPHDAGTPGPKKNNKKNP